MKDRAKWHKEAYSMFWVSQVEKYGFDPYCKGLCELIASKSPRRVYELAIGTGWPFALTLAERNIAVHGSDISELLVSRVRQRNPDIDARVSSYEDVEVPTDVQYDVVYCLRSTWYFPNLFAALDKMFALARPGGWVLFDIMNADSAYVRNIIRTHRLRLPYTIARNTAKKVANTLLGKEYLLQELWNIYELPVSARGVEEYLRDRGVAYRKFSINQLTDGLDAPFLERGDAAGKIVFECRR